MDARAHDADLRPARRLGVLVLAVFQLAAAVALPTADGLLEVERFGVPAHVESEGNDDCALLHDHAFCQVVRATAMATPARVIATVLLGRAMHERSAPASTAELHLSGRLFQGSSGPRAPPAA